MKTPILFIIFNRPETAKRVFQTIRESKTPRLYVAADGPRSNKPGDAEKCKKTRAIIENVDWDCEVKTLFREGNLGCREGVSGAISWFFEQEEEGIILEDDILPVPTFFRYCEELLEKYRDNTKIGMISGFNPVWKRLQRNNGYLFSIYNHIWGWATWRRSWLQYDYYMKDWPVWRASGTLEKLSKGHKPFVYFWKRWMDIAYAGKSGSWDSQWHFTCWKNGWINILPKYNQTFNIGFFKDIEATHPFDEVPGYIMESRPEPLEFPLIHPYEITIDNEIDKFIGQYAYGIPKINYPQFLLRVKGIIIENPRAFAVNYIKKNEKTYKFLKNVFKKRNKVDIS